MVLSIVPKGEIISGENNDNSKLAAQVLESYSMRNIDT